VENRTVPIRSLPAQSVPEDSALGQLQRAVRRQAAVARNPREDLVWQPRFAYTSAAIIFAALTIISLPLWIVLYRITDSTSNNGAGPRVSDLVGLCMMLLGAFLTGAAAWTIIIEMRGRVRMVDTLARTSEREMIAPAAPELPVDAPVIDEALLESPTQPIMFPPLMSGPSAVTAALPNAGSNSVHHGPSAAHAAVTAHQTTVAATLEASSKLLASFSSVLRSFGQLPAQVAMLAVALALFVGATVLSLH
jgi:hypothetical protein